MFDPLEGLSESGLIRTGADIKRVDETFRLVHDAAVAMVSNRDVSASLYAYGSVVTGQAKVGASDVDLFTIGLKPNDTNTMSAMLSTQFGDIARHARRWRLALEAGNEPAGGVARRMARKSLLAVAGLVSVHDHTWTTDRQTGVDRWGEIVPDHQAGLAQMLLRAIIPNAKDSNETTSGEVARLSAVGKRHSYGDGKARWNERAITASPSTSRCSRSRRPRR